MPKPYFPRSSRGQSHLTCANDNGAKRREKRRTPVSFSVEEKVERRMRVQWTLEEPEPVRLLVRYDIEEIKFKPVTARATIENIGGGHFIVRKSDE